MYQMFHFYFILIIFKVFLSYTQAKLKLSLEHLIIICT